MTRELASIDALLAAPKALPGVPAWVETRATATLSTGVLTGGVVIGELRLIATATVSTAEQRGDAALILDGRPLSRMAFNPKHQHTNTARQAAPADLRRLTLWPGTSKLYLWADNRWWPRDRADVLAARAMDPQPATLADALACFLRANTIAGTLSPPPWRPEFEF